MQPEEAVAMSIRPEPSSSLRRDFRIFLDPGFWVALALIGLLCAAAAGILLYANTRYGISPF
jgi:hypothetical protein